MLLIWFGAISFPARRSQYVGARITGGHYSRGRWRDRQEEKARLAREAAARRRRKREREQKERDRVAAFEASLIAAEARHAKELESIDAWADLYALQADGLKRGSTQISEQAALNRILRANAQRVSDSREEEELMEALFAA